MGRIILLIIAGLVAFMIVTWIVHVMMFLFWIALIAVAGFCVLRLAMWSSGRRSRT
jgi:Flp pilus assembly protein TadB